MKKILALLVLAGWIWYLYNIWLQNQNIENAKKDLWVIKSDNKENIENKKEEIKAEEWKKEELLEQKDNSKPSYSVKKLDNKNYIEIDDLTKKVENITDKIKITWKVLNKQVDKIIVKFSNSNSDFADDSYTLKTFKKWNSDFKYNADSLVFRNLDYGENKYIVEAYIWSDKSVLELIINISENTEKEDKKINTEVTYDKKVVWDIVLTLPESELFWNALTLDDWKITYSNIKNLEIIKQDLDKNNLTSETIWNSEGTWYLNTNYSSYTYWNTFREIDFANKDLGVSFYVLSKEWDKLIYEKLYFDFKNNLKWVLKLWEYDVNSEEKITEQMSKLNKQLKEKNKDFVEVEKTDKLFKEIVR